MTEINVIVTCRQCGESEKLTFASQEDLDHHKWGCIRCGWITPAIEPVVDTTGHSDA